MFLSFQHRRALTEAFILPMRYTSDTSRGFHSVFKSCDPSGKKWKFDKTIAFAKPTKDCYFFIPCSFHWGASASCAYAQKWFKAEVLQRCQQLEQKEARSSKNLFSKRRGWRSENDFLFPLLPPQLFFRLMLITEIEISRAPDPYHRE